jgi:type III pantothenate kinase
MLLVADIGNTEITIGLFDKAELRSQWRVMTAVPRTPDELALVLRQLLAAEGWEPSVLHGHAIGSVVPGLTKSFAEACGAVAAVPVRVIDGSSHLPIRLNVDEPAAVGADRILNTLAASTLFSRDCIVVDLGTATTFDCITEDGEFLGGVIAPGVLTSAETLFKRTAMLSATALVAPRSVIGRRTDEALRAGIVLGSAELIDGLVRRIKAEWPTGRPPFVIATGGLAPTFAPLSNTIEKVVPELTLVGLRLAAEWLDGTRSEPPRSEGLRG